MSYSQNGGDRSESVTNNVSISGELNSVNEISAGDGNSIVESNNSQITKPPKDELNELMQVVNDLVKEPSVPDVVKENSKIAEILPQCSNTSDDVQDSVVTIVDELITSVEEKDKNLKCDAVDQVNNDIDNHCEALGEPSSGQLNNCEKVENTEKCNVFKRTKRKNSARNYRARRSGGNSSQDDDDHHQEENRTTSNDQTLVRIEENVDRTDRNDVLRGTAWEGYSLSSSSSSSDSTSSLLSLLINPDTEIIDDKDVTNLPRVLTKPRPRHKWFVVQEVINRQLGVGSRYSGSELFQQRCYGSLHCVQRLELMYKLEAHQGCVNALNFNPSGSILATASDDRKVALWDWALGKCVFTYDSGHSSNVFQAKFLPLSGDCHIVSCARDGQVRLAVLSSTGVCRSTKQLAQHKKPAHKIATQYETPHVFLSAGEDAVVMLLDVREHYNKKLLMCKERGEKIALYSIHSNPINCHEFCITGDDQYIRLYDKRKISAENGCLKKFCPQHLVNNSDVFVYITSAVFNYNGTEILGSFNDEDIYLFDTRHSDGADYVHRYEGHRNSITVKGVNFFGPRSEYIVSGSDCGNIFFWDKNTEAVVQFMRGDEEGVVNCLEPHPIMPVIATSGLDHDVKIWVPSCEQEPSYEGLKSAVSFNKNAREAIRRGDPWDNQMQWLWRQIQRFERRRGRLTRPDSRNQGEGDSAPTAVASEESASGSDEEEHRQRPECSPS